MSAGGHAAVIDRVSNHGGGTSDCTGSGGGRCSLDAPVDAKARGEHGTVVLDGDVSPQRRAVNLTVVESSGSKSLDDLALTRLSNARLGADLLENGATKIRLKVQFYSYDVGAFAEGYSCGQAVLDSDWYARTFPSRGVEEGPLFRLIQASDWLLRDKRLAFAREPGRYSQVWSAAIEVCRKNPNAAFLPTLVSLGAKHR